MTLFALDSLRTGMVIVGGLKAAMFLYVFAAGVYLSTDTVVGNGFGRNFVSGAILASVIAVAAIAVTVLQYFGVKLHNRFLLFLGYSADTLLVVFLLSNSSLLLGFTSPQFSKDLQLGCLRHTPSLPPSACSPFFDAARTAGFRLVWETYFSLASGDALQFAAITSLENGCCGFFAPMACTVNNASFPSEFGTKDIDRYLLRQRVICGNKPGYYPNTSSCTDYFDATSTPPIVGGCHYDMGLGQCLSETVTASSLGCASRVEDFMIGRVLGHVYAMMASTILCAVMQSVSRVESKIQCLDYHYHHMLRLVETESIRCVSFR